MRRIMIIALVMMVTSCSSMTAEEKEERQRAFFQRYYQSTCISKGISSTDARFGDCTEEVEAAVVALHKSGGKVGEKRYKQVIKQGEIGQVCIDYGLSIDHPDWVNCVMLGQQKKAAAEQRSREAQAKAISNIGDIFAGPKSDRSTTNCRFVGNRMVCN